MKTTVFILSIVVAIFVLGCQDNSSMNPVADQQLSASAAVLGKPKPISLPLKGFLRDPMSLNGLTEISGQLQVSIAGQALLEVTLNTDANLKPNDEATDQAPWKVSCRTTDWIKVLPGKSVSLDKSYCLAGRTDGATLHLIITITRDGEGISRKFAITKLYLVVPKATIHAQASTD